MSDTQKEEGQKTIVSFVVGLLIGGLLVWAFSGNNTEAPEKDKKDAEDAPITIEIKDDNTTNNIEVKTETATPEIKTMNVGEGKVVVVDQKASTSVVLNEVTYPSSEGWIGVRSYQNESLGYILGVMRYSQEQSLVPETVELQTPTIAGRSYAIVFFSENGDRAFNLANDVQVDKIFATFKAE